MVWIAVAYVAGSVPFGYLLGRAHGVDIRAAGSGNVGATNLGRLVLNVSEPIPRSMPRRAVARL